MPIAYKIDTNQRVVFSTMTGVVDMQQITSTAREIWSRSEVAGFNEVLDLSAVERFVDFTPKKLSEFAASVRQLKNFPQPAQVALVAESDLAFGICRMFVTHRELVSGPKRELEVFRSRAEALAWLGISEPS